MSEITVFKILEEPAVIVPHSLEGPQRMIFHNLKATEGMRPHNLEAPLRVLSHRFEALERIVPHTLIRWTPSRSRSLSD